jgi:hypothetical protein
MAKKSTYSDPVGYPESERKYRVDSALRTLTDAECIRKDKDLMRDVEKARKAKIDDLESIKVEVAHKTIGKGKK